MYDQVEKTPAKKSQIEANGVSQRQSSHAPTSRFVDNRPEAIQMRKLRELAKNSPQNARLRELHHLSAAHSVAQKKSNVKQGFGFVDNRPEAIAQRKLKNMMNNSPQNQQFVQFQKMEHEHVVKQEQPIQKKEKNTGLPDNLKSGIENLSGYSMDDVKVHYNSDKPAQLNAHAYAQGTDIHLGSGQEKYLPHEAWHVVQQKQGRVKPTMQMKGKVNINDDAGLEKEADVMGAKAQNASQSVLKDRILIQENPNQHLNDATPAQPVMQKVSSVIVGETHGLQKINVERKTTIFSTRPEFGWMKKAEPSKLAAALIQHNGFIPPANYQSELERQMKKRNGLKDVMTTAESISNGKEESWGAEDNLIGYRSSATVSNDIAPKDTRTHIENTQVRKDASFLRTLSQIGGHSIPPANVKAGHPNQSGYQILQSMGVQKAERELSSVTPAIKNKWTALKATNGLLGKVYVLPPPITPTNAKRDKERWINQTTSNIESGLQELIDISVTEICKILGDEFNYPLKSKNPGEKLIKDIANLRYGHQKSVLSRMHAVASLARTITQLGGMYSNNEDYQNAKPNVTNLKTGYIVGDNHLHDFTMIKKVHNENDRLKSMIDNATIVRRKEYGDLETSLKKAVVSTNRLNNRNVLLDCFCF